jgi:hypothetical protein
VPTEDPGGSCRVLVACLPQDLSDAPYDAFVTRHRRMVETIAAKHSVAVLCLRTPGDPVPAPSFDGVEEVLDVTLPEVIYTATRSARLRAALRSCGDIESKTDGAIALVALSARPDVVVTVGPWLGAEYRPLFGRFPTMHLFEEDMTRQWEIASQSWQGRLFRRVETWLYGRAKAQPKLVVTISRRETDAAQRRYPRATNLYLPLTLPRDAWPVFATPSEGEVVLVVGNLAQARNSEGLTAVLGEMARRDDAAAIRVRIVSDSGLHPSLQPFVDEPWVEYARPAGFLPDRYREAWAALVPAQRVTGQKTTILQAWTCACPVVCFESSAVTVGVPDAVLAGLDAPQVVDQLVALSRSPATRQALVRAGLAALSLEFDPETEDERVRGAIEYLRHVVVP